MQAAVAIISVSRSIHHKLSFHCHVMYIFPKYFMYVCIYFQNKGIRIRIRIRMLLSSSYPDAEFAIAEMIVEISLVFISGICSGLSMFRT